MNAKNEPRNKQNENNKSTSIMGNVYDDHIPWQAIDNENIQEE